MSRSVWKGPYVHPSMKKMITNQLKLGLVVVRLFRRWLV